MPTKKTDPRKDRILLVVGTDPDNHRGKLQWKLEVKADQYVTFGPTIPGPHTSGQGYALRVYRHGVAKEKGLLACFPGVLEFREADITVLPW